eukprot:gene379-10043_t
MDPKTLQMLWPPGHLTLNLLNTPAQLAHDLDRTYSDQDGRPINMEKELTSSDDTVLGHDFSVTEAKIHLKSFLESPRAVVLFVQDKLSFDDVTKYGRKSFESKSTVFQNLQKFFDKNGKAVIPSVVKKEGEMTLTALLRKQHAGQVKEIYSSDIDLWNYDKSAVVGKKLFIFHLPPVEGSTEKGKMSILSKNDDIMGKIISQFDKHDMYTALLTAAEPSDIFERIHKDASDGTGLKRHLLSVQSSAGQLFNLSTCFFLYANSIKLTYGGHSAEMINATATQSGKCSNNQSTMSFAKLSNTDWACSAMDVTYSGTLGKGTEETGVKFDYPGCPTTVTAPKSAAYTCGSLQLKSINDTSTVTFGRFQVQPFGTKGQPFANAYDCVDFFTIPILTGLFVTALLISIVFGGIFAMMGISTMDRFDDPKGPTIQVPHE